MPNRKLSNREREDMSATSMLADKVSVDPKVWTPAHFRVIQRAAAYPEVERVLVHPAIKRTMCTSATGDRTWLGKVRPIWGHHYHFHIRIGCPPGSAGCQPQAAPPSDDGCGKEVDDWLKRLAAPPPPPPKVPPKPVPPKPPITLDALPDDCRVVLDGGAVPIDAKPARTGSLKRNGAPTKPRKAKASDEPPSGAALAFGD